MLNLIFSLGICLVAFTTFTLCTNISCREEDKFYFCAAFCVSNASCKNETGRASLERLRDCMTSNDTETKQNFESANKLETYKCIDQLDKKACDFINDLENTDKYAHCKSQLKEFKPSMAYCVGNDGNMADKFYDMATIYCAPTIKCRSDDALELKNLVLKCLTEKMTQLNQIIDKTEQGQCKRDVSNVLYRARQIDKLNDFISCMSPKKALLDKFSSEDCDYVDRQPVERH